MAYLRLTGVYDNGDTRGAEVPRIPAKELQLAVGETATIELTLLYISGLPFPVAEDDALTLTVRDPSDPEVEPLEVVFTAQEADTGKSTVQLRIEVADTEELPAGRYIYDVWHTRGADRAQVVKPSALLLRPAIGVV